MTETTTSSDGVMPFRPPVPSDTAPSDWFTRTSLEIEERISFDDWSAIGQWIQTAVACSPWWLGDWAAYGELQFGDDFYAAVDSTLFDKSFFARTSMTAQAFPPELRNENLSWEHHEVIATRERGGDKERTAWLAFAMDGCLSPGVLAKEIRRSKEAIDAGSVDGKDGSGDAGSEKVYPKDPPTYTTVRMSFRIDTKHESVALTLKDSLAATVRVGLEDAGCDVSKTETAVSH